MNEKNNDIERRAAQYPGLTLYRVISQEKGLYRIAGEAGEREAVVAGKLQYQARQPSDYPAVGDYVMADPGQGRGMIQAVLERKSVLMRKTAGSSHVAQMIAANVDTVFVCMSLNNDLNPRRLERYLTVCWEGGAAPVVATCVRTWMRRFKPFPPLHRVRTSLLPPPGQQTAAKGSCPIFARALPWRLPAPPA